MTIEKRFYFPVFIRVPYDEDKCETFAAICQRKIFIDTKLHSEVTDDRFLSFEILANGFWKDVPLFEFRKNSYFVDDASTHYMFYNYPHLVSSTGEFVCWNKKFDTIDWLKTDV